MTPQARATEIPALVRRLGSRRQSQVDAARARLAIIGARAVESLVEALEGDDNRVRSHAMPLLALIQDPRGREPLMAMLLDRDARMRETAARCLARFPAQQTVAALERLLKKEKVADVRVSAVHALVEQYAAGQEVAPRRVLEILCDREEKAPVRLAAFALLPHLRSSERRGLLRRLRQDSSQEVVRKAMALDVAVGSASDRDAAEVEAALADLASPDYALWNKAVHRLTDHGAAVVEPVVNEMRRRSHDPEYCTRAGMVLKALGPRRGRTLADALDRVDEPLPLQVLVEVIGALGDKPLIYRLKELIGRIRGRQGRSDGTNAFDPTQRAVAKAHLELARIGSRVAIQDLRDALTDRNRRLEVEMLGAVELIGKRDEIPDLLRAYLREDRYIRQRIGTAIRTIMRRERIRRSNRVFRAMGPRLDRALEQILSSRGSADRPQRQRVVKH